MRYIPVFWLFLFLSVAFTPARAAQADQLDREEILRDYSVRYSFDSWPGKHGSVIPGVNIEKIFGEDRPLLFDHDEWLNVEGEWILKRQYTYDNGLTIEVAVARSCEKAHEFLFAHLARQNTMKPLDPPALPFGRVRLPDIGDVCFGLPQHGDERYHGVSFARNNIVILLSSKGKVPVNIIERASIIDDLLLAQPVFPDWESSKRWISIESFELPETRAAAGTVLPLAVDIDRPGNDAYSVTWDVSSGGIVEENGSYSYYAEGAGVQTITMKIADRRGLTATAALEVEITE